LPILKRICRICGVDKVLIALAEDLG